MADERYEVAGAEFDETPPFDSDEQGDEEDADREFDGEDEDDEGVD